VVRIPIRVDGGAGRRGILRLRRASCFANRPAPLRITGLRACGCALLRILGIGLMGLLWCFAASATTYYVSSTSGSDANSGTSSASPWQTLAKVNAQTLAPGDSVLLRRGDSWNESLIPSSSGTSANKISFDAYGAGAPPTLTGYYAMPSSGWVLVSGNAWKAPLPSTFTTVNFCLFGSIWGQKVAVGTSNLKGTWDFYIANGYLYVYSSGNPSTFYSSIVPMALSNVPVIHVNGRSWLSFQHILVNWFDQYGVHVQGASDHLVFANMETDSMIPQGTQPLGFYMNASVPPLDVKILSSEAHMNYDGFRFDGAAAAITLINDKAYGRAVAQVADMGAIARLAMEGGDGVRGLVRTLKAPAARTQADCENAALALLDDASNQGWAGRYMTWSDFLPGGARDIFPGDAVVVNVPSRGAEFEAVVRSVEIEYRDPANDRGVYSVEFANDAAGAISMQTEASATAVPLQDVPARLATTQVGSYYLSSLVNAQVTQVTSTTVQVDAGMSPGSGLGIEVRTRDFGWGSNDRNFLGRLSARTFTLPRLGRTQTYFLRLYDGSSPTRYSRYAAVLHVDYPL